jgi:formylglycine-generating enzyme required for sulfatase activity
MIFFLLPSSTRWCSATYLSALDELDQMVRIPAGTFVMESPDGETPVIGWDGKPRAEAPAPAEEGRFDA